jgi:hypothetical protein
MIQRRVIFDPSDPKAADRFKTIYTGFLIGGQEKQQRATGPKGKATILLEAEILKKLENCSHVPEPAVLLPTNDPIRVLNTEGAEVLNLTPQELELLLSYLENTSWTVGAARTVADTFSFLELGSNIDV